MARLLKTALGAALDESASAQAISPLYAGVDWRCLVESGETVSAAWGCKCATEARDRNSSAQHAALYSSA